MDFNEKSEGEKTDDTMTNYGFVETGKVNYFYDRLKTAVVKGTVLKGEPMKNHCSFKTGGNADYYVVPYDTEELCKAVTLCALEEPEPMPCIVIGNGSNLLIGDKGIRGVVIQLSPEYSKIEGKDGEYIIDAGMLLSSAASRVCDEGYAGMEFASGIPGSFGGAVIMNAGAYGGEMKDIIKWVKVFDVKQGIKTIEAKDMEFGYRTSAASKNNWIVLQGCIKLKKGNIEEIKAEMTRLNAQRREKQPLNYPSAGSTFKRPEGYFAGKLIEDCGLKGYTCRNAMVSEKHAGFVINKGGATTEDILNVIKHCQKEVYDKFGIKLETEVKLLGEF